MTFRVRGTLPLAASLVVLTGVLAHVFVSATGRIGTFSYALDDSYIHMAIAKNVATHGVWGVTPYAFSSSSSSPLWTALLAGLYALLGPRHSLPLWIDVGLAAGLLVVAFFIVRRHELPAPAVFALLAGLVLLVPLAPIVFGGMEHVLHAGLAIGFVAFAARAVANEDRAAERWLLLVSFLFCGVRYESAFLVAPACTLLLLRRRVRLALALAAVSSLPFIVMGAYNVAQGWPFLPISVLLKGNDGRGFSVGSWSARAVELTALATSDAGCHLTWLIALASMLFLAGLVRRRGPREERQAGLAMFIAAAMLHMALAGLGWLYRYEAYLMAVGFVSIAVAAWEIASGLRRAYTGGTFALVLLLMFVPLSGRALRAHEDTLFAIRNIHEQQVQMGRFLAMFYSGATVAANDIGAVDWYADLKLLDTWGLASRDVAIARLAGRCDVGMLEFLSNSAGVDIAVVYMDWLPGAIPRSWRRIGEWQIADNHVCGSDVVTFFAVGPETDERLRQNLVAFARVLPSTVRWVVPPPRR